MAENTLTTGGQTTKLPRKGIDTLREAVKRQNGQAFHTNELFLEIVAEMYAEIEGLKAMMYRRTFKVER